MIYASERFLFLHIPRTAGLTITRTLGAASLQVQNTLVATGPRDLLFWRHTPARNIRDLVADWDSIFKWAVSRDPWSIVDSLIRLAIQQEQTGEPRGIDPAWWAMRDEAMQIAKGGPLTPYIERWFGYIADAGGFWQWHCCGPNGEDYGIEAVPYCRLHELWPAITERCGVPLFDLPRDNLGLSGHLAWTAEDVALVRRFAAKDIERFGFEPPAFTHGSKSGPANLPHQSLSAPRPTG